MVSGVALMTLVGWVGDRRDPTRFLRVLEGKLEGSSGHLQSLISTCRHAAGFKQFVKLDIFSSDTDPVAFPCPTWCIANEQRKHLDVFIGSSCPN